jgi:hypothetical protein
MSPTSGLGSHCKYLDPSFEAFMEQRGKLLKEYVDESIKKMGTFI